MPPDRPVVQLGGAGIDRLRSRFGDAVLRWVDGLDALAGAVAHDWAVRITGPVRVGGTSVVVHGVRDGRRVVLTLTPEPPVAVEEAQALRAWAPCEHVVELIAADGDRGALLLEDLRPGVPLTAGWELDDVLPLLADLMTLPPPDRPTGLADVAHRVAFMFGLADRRPATAWLRPLLAAGHARARDLAASPGAFGVVHGDLHPGNVLRTADHRGVVAIDPRPSLGDRHLDLVDWALAADVADPPAFDARLDALADGIPGLDRARTRAWAVALAPLVLVPLVARDPASPRVRWLTDLVRGER